MLAASTASALPASSTSAICSNLPAPPLATTGTPTDSLTRRVISKAGFDLEITRRVSESVGVPVVASGGAGKLEHMADVLEAGKADAVLAASIFHFGEY